MNELEGRTRGGHATGWGHNLKSVGKSSDKPTTALASAYGLKASRMLGDPVDLATREAVAEAILDSRGDSGLWRARTQRADTADVSATIIAGIATTVGLVRTADAISRVEASVDALRDDAGMDRVFSISSVVCSLISVNPASRLLPELIDRLCEGSKVHDGGKAAWGRILSSAPGSPSTPHTARAVTALGRAKRMQDVNGLRLLNKSQQRLLQDGLDFLASVEPGDLALETENIERDSGGASNVLVVRHFTPALVLRALAESEAGIPLLDALSVEVMRYYKDGAFWWSEAEAPIWMLYQGVSALNASVMCRGAV